jgi:hypothetical protein
MIIYTVQIHPVRYQFKNIFLLSMLEYFYKNEFIGLIFVISNFIG